MTAYKTVRPSRSSRRASIGVRVICAERSARNICSQPRLSRLRCAKAFAAVSPPEEASPIHTEIEPRCRLSPRQIVGPRR